ncbi:substrate-binding domain-containing protein [Nocardioides sp.]|uniref:substrate-binding domain-containing protein n=1 Tax=Nocardioides sp. TaxID=35761 RepID=UPI00286E0EE2|nr:substrate-binding domain-containing protein [Nocardioides sp.]
MDVHSETLDGRIRGPVMLVLLLLLGVALGGGAAYLLINEADPEPAARGCEQQRTVQLAVPLSMLGVVTRAVEEIVPACTRVAPDTRTASQIALAVSTGARPPDVWIAESRFWMTPTYLGGPAALRVVTPSVARTPLLLVGGPAAPRFASWGAAEVSGLVSVPDPLSSTVGSLAVVAPQAEAAELGRDKALARQMVVPFAQAYGERVSRGLDADVGMFWARRSSRRLVVGTEQELVEARINAPYLRDLTPSIGAPVLDFPMAVRQGAAPGSGALARDLVRYLASEEGADALREAGLRPAAAPDDTLGASVSAFLPTPPARTVAATVQSWRTLSVPSAILAVVDASGSMDFDASGGTRMGLLADAAGIGLSFLPDHARVGLWIFSIDKGGPGQDWRVLEPMRRLDDLRFGRTQRFALRARAQELPALTGGGTGLYDTALAAYQQALRDYRPHYSNAVVLMTDGENEDPGSIALEELVRRLGELRDPDRPVRIVGIAISEDADLGALEQMADATGGAAYLAAQPGDILGVFAQAVLSR